MSKTLVILLIFSSTLLLTYTAGQGVKAVSPQTCKAEEEWKKKNGQDGCFCIYPFSITNVTEVKPDLTCEAFDMVATFHKCQFKDVNINFTANGVEKKICYDIIDDDATNTITIKAPINEGSCAFKSQETSDTQVTYTSNFIIVLEVLGLIVRFEKLNVTLQCSYDLNMITSLHKTLKPIISTVNISVDGLGAFKVYMTLFQNSDYTDPYTGSDVTLKTDKFLYVGVFVYGGDHSTLLLVMNNCYATPTNNVNDPLKYYIIQERCPNKADGTITVDENGKSREGKFSVQMFKFVGNYDNVYLHCNVSLCDTRKGSCIPNCFRRSDGTGNAQTYDASAMTIGPIKRSGEPIPPTTPKPIPPTTPKAIPPTTSKSGPSTITSAYILWTLLIPALAILI